MTKRDVYIVHLHCSSPSCSRLIPMTSDQAQAHPLLIPRSWKWQQHEGDDARRPYCPRCST